MSISVDSCLYYYACRFLWYVLSLYLYLIEEFATEKINSSADWHDACDILANWVADESNVLLKSEKAGQEERDALYALAIQKMEVLMPRWADDLRLGSLAAHEKISIITETMWLHYYYCRFLLKVLQEFEQLLRSLDETKGFYRRYQDNIMLFDNVKSSSYKERPFFNRPNDISQQMADELLAEMETFVIRLSGDWRQAIYSVAKR